MHAKHFNNIHSLWLANIYSKQWCESEYLKYLEDERFGMNADYYLYQTSASTINAKNNIDILSSLYNNYIR